MSPRISIAVLAAGLLAGPAVQAAGPGGFDPVLDQAYGAGTLDERVAKLEKRLSGESMAEMLNRIEQLQGDVLRMRGEIEELSHALDLAKQQQAAMYTDLDQRLRGSLPPGQQPPATENPNPAPAEEPAGAAPPPPPVVQAPPRAPAPAAPAAPAVDPNAAKQAAYQKGLNLLKDGKYPESIREFKGFLAANPGGENADNALYWMGEAYYVLRDFTASRDAYRKLIRDYPQSSRVADALLKIGYIEYDGGQWVRARDLLNDVVKRFPGTNAATQAQKKLAKIKQEGH
ncbi:tol-pal system protein YbgF [Methylococcus sp. EFPC2]|uniref:tol-pal system protein YbgF n=1 Tax=Methylococcus sp. EFPC2 TaxID=2812648 RepID=UPI00196861CB|nr:tol-pal system protein YbgF [Methylococcus sp. EFPC2]QSA95794.1 tol-pal system protein YbgF [Methylococcus sp. EFPC2]